MNQFALEGLEPRLLLSADPVSDPGACPVPPDQLDPLIAAEMPAPAAPEEGVCSLLDFDPETLLEPSATVLPSAGDATIQSTPAPAGDEAGEHPPAPVEPEVAEDAGGATLGASTAEPDPSTEGSPTASGADDAQTVTAQLTETLRAANGPPAEEC